MNLTSSRGAAGVPTWCHLCVPPHPHIRVRPLTCTETRRGDRQVVHSLGDGTVHVSATSPRGPGTVEPPPKKKNKPPPPSPGERGQARRHLWVQRRLRCGRLAGGRVRGQRHEAAGGAGDRWVSPPWSPPAPYPHHPGAVQASAGGLHCRAGAGRWHLHTAAPGPCLRLTLLLQLLLHRLRLRTDGLGEDLHPDGASGAGTAAASRAGRAPHGLGWGVRMRRDPLGLHRARPRRCWG